MAPGVILAGLVTRDRGAVGVGDRFISDVLKLLVLESTGSNFLQDLTRSLSLPNVETTLILS